ncbi:hypothetical protein F4803DRAFT_520801 [Xylaria telfairii]|nr:hypothetical protein F4803DRAFT_520801 [Xylaria telfairii]
MSAFTLPIIYLTGATATGKSTIGKMLASLRAGVPEMPEPIRAHIKNNTVIPEQLLAPYTTVPAVLAYHNHRASERRNWSIELASVIFDEAITRATELARSEGSIQGIIIDWPLTSGKVSLNMVERYRSAYAGLTIVLESTRELSMERYLSRARLRGDNKEGFEKRMELTDRGLPEFIGHIDKFHLKVYHGGFAGEIVRSTNDETMWIMDAYMALLSNLGQSNAWLAFTKQTQSPV